jgi:hypothetical protein
MTPWLRLLRGIIRLYPTRWRAEYGNELEALLASRPFTLAVALDLVRNALIQRFRDSEPWKICAVFLLAWTTGAMVRNTLQPFSEAEYAGFTNSVLLAVFATAFWTTFLGTAGIKGAAEGAAKAALVSALPDVLISLLWAAGVVNPGIIDPASSISRRGGQVAILYVRSTLQISPIEVVFLEACGVSVSGLVVGGLGATIGRLFRPLAKGRRA